MTVNSYFASNYSGTQAEQRLMADLIKEQIQNFGRDFYYLPRNLVAFDKLYGEDKLSAFTRFYPLEFYIQSTNSYDGQQEIISKFGFEVRDEMTLVCSKERFKVEIASKEEGYISPREGDLIFNPLDKSLFEITFVDNEKPFYQFGRFFTYTINLKRFELASEQFDTGINIIDNAPINYGNTTEIMLFGGGVGTFQSGEIVIQGPSPAMAFWFAEVIGFNEQEGKLIVTKIRGEFDKTVAVTGVTSNATWLPAPQPTGQINVNNPETDKASDAKTIFQDDVKGPPVVDRDERNPYAYGYD